MLNLLPADIKQDYRYARINRHLVNWITALVVGIAGAMVLTGFGYLYLQRTINTYKKQVGDSQAQLRSQNLDGIQKQVKDISGNLQLAVDVLSRQVLFSELLTQLGTLMPANTNLTALSISQAQGAISISANAKDYASASQIQVNLSAKDNKLFSKADIVSINCSGDTAYPCSITIRALFASQNPYIVGSPTGSKK